MVRRLVIVTLVLLSAGLAAVPALASHSQSLTFEAPRDLLDPSGRVSTFDQIASLGARRLRIVLYWHDVAASPDSSTKPKLDAADPASYDWSKYDPAVDEAKARGWPVLLTVSGPVPKWATLARRDTRTRPSPTEFTRFTEAVAKHYAGRISRFSIWNEPNLPRYLLPQYFKGQVASPRWYRKLFFAGVRGLKRGGIAKPSVLVGETAPRGTATAVAPLIFLRKTLCLNKSYKRNHSCARLPAAGYAHHPYTTPQGPFFVPPKRNDVTIGVLSRLVTALDRAARTGAIVKHMPIYLTEFGIQSVPDPYSGVSQHQQAEFQAISERLAWDQPRVKSFSQYLLRDDKPLTGVPSSKKYGGFESGLRLANGKAKLSYAAFPVPLTALRKGNHVSLWGLARPTEAKTKVTVLYGKTKFRTYKRYTTNSHGYFTRTVPYVSGRKYRLRWVSPKGKIYKGPPIRVYTRR